MILLLDDAGKTTPLYAGSQMVHKPRLLSSAGNRRGRSPGWEPTAVSVVRDRQTPEARPRIVPPRGSPRKIHPENSTCPLNNANRSGRFTRTGLRPKGDAGIIIKSAPLASFSVVGGVELLFPGSSKSRDSRLLRGPQHTLHPKLRSRLPRPFRRGEGWGEGFLSVVYPAVLAV